jgi:V8-like Glu-specific endopeptidase
LRLTTMNSQKALCAMFTIFVATFFLTSPLTAQDGIDVDFGTVTTRLRGGTPVNTGEFDAVGTIPGCTATLITDNLVLTAAHCVCRGDWRTNGCDTRTVFTLDDVLLVGTAVRQNVTIHGTVRVHPEFENPSWLANDIAVIELDQPASNLVQDLTPLSVEQPYRSVFRGETLTLVGYGATGADCSQPSNGKQKVSAKATHSDGGAIRFNYNDKGVCWGDSGGPALNSRGNVVGVASWFWEPDGESTYRPTSLGYNFIFSLPRRNWSSTSWIPIEAAGINSHAQGAPWCPENSFMIAFDLDGDRNISPSDSPVVRQVQCATISDVQWGELYWVEVGGIKSHNPFQSWCFVGSFLVGFDLDQFDDRGFYDPHDAPIVGRALCATLANSAQSFWGSSYWNVVGAINSHNSNGGWCLDGTFLTQFDLDRWDSNVRPDAYDAPIVGQAKCSRPH